MKFYYQLILLGEVPDENKLVEILNDEFEKLGVDKSFLKILSHKIEYEKRMPVFCLYFGCKNGGEESLAERLIENGVSVLPVIKNAPAARTDLKSSCLKKINAAFLCQGLGNVASFVMSGFGLIRKRRKVFISYKRSESRKVAVQLYEKLSESGFEVFLDTHSIQKGLDFQEDLYHQLMDCDVVVLLNSKNFFESEWTCLEFQKANSMSLGIVQVMWPSVERSDNCLLTEAVFLDEESFTSQKKISIRSKKIKQIVSAVEVMRIRSFASRKNMIISNMLEIAKCKNEKIVFVGESVYKNVSRGELYIPEMGFPQSESFDYARKFQKGKCIVVYDPTNVKKSWLEYLNWVNKSLSIKTRPINEGN